MIPDIEREWIAEESRTTPRPARRLWLTLLLLGAAGWALYQWLR